MCIITGDTKSVTNTRILVGATADGRQLTVYSNQVQLADGAVAMILPVPKGRDGVQFVDLSAYDDLFDDLDAFFPKPQQNYSFGMMTNSLQAQNLPVFQVGSYKCSFAPCIDDLGRLRFDVFQLPGNIRALLEKSYSATFGYVVCILDRDAKFHPFGYIHSLYSTRLLWVPTRHQHGTQYEEIFSHWDHEIYSLNTTDETTAGTVGQGSGAHMKWHLLPALRPMECVRKLTVKGNRVNQDVFLKIK